MKASGNLEEQLRMGLISAAEYERLTASSAAVSERPHALDGNAAVGILRSNNVRAEIKRWAEGAVIIALAIAVVGVLLLVMQSLDGIGAVAAVPTLMAVFAARLGMRRTDVWRAMAMVCAVVGCLAVSMERPNSLLETSLGIGSALVCAAGFASPLLMMVSILCAARWLLLYSINGLNPSFQPAVPLFVIGLLFFLAFAASSFLFVKPGGTDRGRATVVAGCSLASFQILMALVSLTGGNPASGMSIPLAMLALTMSMAAVVVAANAKSRPLVWISTVCATPWVVVLGGAITF